MKKLILSLVTVVTLFPLVPVQAGSEAKPILNASEEPTEVSVILARLDEIKSMDFSSMTKAEKKNLRQEVRDLKREARALSGGVYLSAGAIIIILLILILVT
jgi:hypothetical protein